MRAKSIRGKSPEEIQSALQQSMADGFKPTIAIAFISVKQDRKVVCEIFQKENIDLIGATSCNEFIDGHQSEGEIAVMLFNINKNDYGILLEDIGERTLQQAAEHLAKSALQKFQKPSLILLSTSMTEKGI
ncbi:MAG TPA: FIST N-terminal domain-containing protein, partial [Chitinophagaceae bacterium]